MKRSPKAIFVHRNGRVSRIRSPKASQNHQRYRRPLLILPLEVRQLIYRYVVESPDALEILPVRKCALAFVNRQLFREVNAAFFEYNRFRVLVNFQWTPPESTVVRGFQITPTTLSELPALPYVTKDTRTTRLPTKAAPAPSPPSAEDVKARLAANTAPPLAAHDDPERIFRNIHNAAWSQREHAHWKQRWSYTIEKVTSGSQNWLKVFADDALIKDITFELYIDPPDDPWLALRIKLLTQSPGYSMEVTQLSKRPWEWPHSSRMDFRYKRRDAAFRIAEQRLRDTVENVTRKDPPLGFSLRDVEAMVDAFDVAEHEQSNMVRPLKDV